MCVVAARAAAWMFKAYGERASVDATSMMEDSVDGAMMMSVMRRKGKCETMILFFTYGRVYTPGRRTDKIAHAKVRK